ncbi:hypothetical protein Hamer_G017242 [Homarus americanus]|uniref:Uncharacterized protein n=1 Tax=Homarus americanus TaxID=6706 RepID=A0A8J5JVR5_HOMAM|nr:hypothetical protein Hamer_G017242 [Homarus americanus]
MGSGEVPSLIPPPVPPARPDRGKKVERNKRSEGPRQESEGGHKGQRAGGSNAATHKIKAHPFCDELPVSAAGEDRQSQPVPSRRSFRLAGHVSDLSNKRNMLPLWLEENNGVVRQVVLNTKTNEETLPANNDTPFETRWDSLRGKNKIRSSSHSEKRPPGWEDVGHGSERERVKGGRTDKFCPSFVIKEVPQNELKVTDNHKLSPVMNDSSSSVPVRRRNQKNKHQRSEANAFDFKNFSETVENIFPESFTQGQKCSISTSNVAPQSASNSPSHIVTGGSSPAITDRHLWTSSDSFICEDFTLYDGKHKNALNNVLLEPPRSYSQVLLQTISNTQDDFFDPEDAVDDGDDQLSENFVPDSNLEAPTPEACAISNDSLYVIHDNYGGNVFTDERKSMENAYRTSPHSPRSTAYSVFDGEDPHVVGDDYQGSAATLRLTDDARRGHWITFDGSTEHLNFNSDDTYEFISADNSTQELQGEIPPISQALGMYTASPPSTDEQDKSILNPMHHNAMHASDNYRGRLIRTYSQRGRRASKRVINSVSRRINTAEYSKLREPVAPMYSRAVLTMNSGPGLFEPGPPKSVCREREDGMEAEVKETPFMTSVTSPDKATSRLFLEPNLPERVGSLRVPRLSSVLVRRSVSLNVPKVEREVPFQRLPDRRSGSFRKAISGLGALARSFRRKSGSELEPVAASESSTKTPRQSVCRRGSFNSASNRQTPKAPRLPRRATSHKQVTAVVYL